MWVVSLKSETSPSTPRPPLLLRLKPELEKLGGNAFPLLIPSLRVGTLDSLLALSDDLAKLDTTSEAVVSKVLRTLRDVTPTAEDAMVINPSANTEVPLRTYLASFSWNDSMFPLSLAPKEIADRIAARIGDTDDALKQKTAEHAAVKSQLASVTRRDQGSLLVRSLAPLIPKEAIVESEYLTTVYVCVPGFSEKEFVESYESLNGCKWVVPGTGRKVAEDKDYVLYAVVVFRKFVDDFRTACREHKYTVREVSTENIATHGDEKARLETLVADATKELTLFARSATSDAYTAWIHLKVLRIFVESVLRYGLPPLFTAVLVIPGKKNDQKVHSVFKAFLPKDLLGNDDGKKNTKDDDDFAALAGPGQSEFFQYPFLRIDVVSK
eukprot:ANDGO_08619.mRNA.1 V-type proton ATPase subunit C